MTDARLRAARGATNPPRGLTAELLAAVERRRVQQIVTALLAESGITVTELSIRGDHDELVLSLAPGWRSREGRARIYYRAVRKVDLNEVDRLARQTPLSEAIVFEVFAQAGGRVTVPASVQFVPANDLIERLEDSAVVQWDGSDPKVDRTLLARLRAVDRAKPWVDEAGIRALPVLARNKLPAAWSGAGQPPDELFERTAFRMLTQTFRFGGVDLGAQARAEREPDALLEAPVGSPSSFSAILDCKAARDGWSMGADDETRLANYVTAHRDDLAHPEEPFLIVLSSNFTSGTIAYTNRQNKVREECGARLVYWRAADLSASALAIEAARLDLKAREGLPWEAYLAQGRPTGSIETFDPSAS